MPTQETAIQGVTVLHELATGVPLAILESTYLTTVRTGLAGALGAEILSRPLFEDGDWAILIPPLRWRAATCGSW